MWIKNVRIFTEDRKFVPGAVEIEGERIKRVSSYYNNGENEKMEGEIIDGGGDMLLPGLTDIHFHGCRGFDVCDGTQEALSEIARYEASIGVTQICPATMTLAEERLCAILSNMAAFRESQQAKAHGGEADLVGVNMEGPFISYEKKGAQNAQFIVPRSLEVFRKYQESAGGLVKFIAIAPEMTDEKCAEGRAVLSAGNGDVVDAPELAGESVEDFVRGVGDSAVVSIAHSNADYDAARAALLAGASHGVHMFNAMPEFLHRAPGIVGALYDDGDATGELICDGIHVHPSVTRNTLRLLGDRRLILISDSMRAAGMDDGLYELGGQEVRVRGNLATLTSDGAIAGSVTTLPDCVRFAVKEAGLPLETAIACAAENSAR
ncbi:MAG: amidohydrolase family protein, partial [Lachnospiraceae bacterium]|nr:amidohydrolase family protein [Lachnospiraceae bacterium]